MGIEAYLAQIRGRGVDAAFLNANTVSHANAVGRGWRGLLKSHIYSKSVKTGVAGDELGRLVGAWPSRETVGTRRDVHPLDISMGPFWRADTSVPMAWANVDFDAPCRACVERDEEATCAHKEPLAAAVELAWADAFSFHRWLEQCGLQASGFVDGRFEAGDYTFVLSGRRGVGILLARLLAPKPYRGLRQLLDDVGGDWPTLDRAALRSKPGPVRVPLSQHPGESDSERAGLRLPLDPELLGSSLSPEDARALQEHSLALGRAARDGELEKVERLPKIFADVMLPKVDPSGVWDRFVARLEERAPEQSGSSDQPGVAYESHGVPEDIRRACRDLGLYRGDGNHSVLVDCPCCGESTAWVNRDRMLQCFRKKCEAAKNEGGLSFDSWHRRSHLPAAQILRVFSQCAGHSGATEHAVSALGGLAANGLPLASDHVRPSNEAEQGAVAFFDPWLTAHYWQCLPVGTSNAGFDASKSHASELYADAEGLLSSIGSGHVSLEELPADASSEGVDAHGPTFEYLASDRWRELARRVAATDELHLEFDANDEFVWLSLPDQVRLVTKSQVLCNEPIHEALAQLELLSISTRDDIRRLLDDRVPYAALRKLPIRTLELPVRLLNNRRQRLRVPFSRWRLARKLRPERVSPLCISRLLYEAVEHHGLTETCRLENAIAVDAVALERSAPRVDAERVGEVREQLREEIADLERPLQRFIGPCASMHQPDDVKARFAEDGVVLDSVSESAIERAAERATGATARRLEAYSLWKQKVRRANELRSLDCELSDDGRARPTVDQLGTCTGRFSWASPPLASISKETRQYLIPAHGRKFVSLDISQAQLRIVAELSGDSALLEVFEAKDDIHTAIAAQLFGEEPNDSRRSQAKAVSFGVLLGMGSGTLVDYAADFGADVSGAEAVKLIDRFIEQFPGVRWYRQDLFLAMLRRGAVVAPSWRRCKFDQNDDGLHHGTTLAYILQMMEADIIKSALLGACEELDLDRARPSMVLHDELMVEAEQDYVDEAAAILERAMSESLGEHLRQCPEGPLESKVSRCWGEGARPSPSPR